MATAGKALKAVLDIYGIRQNHLAVAMGLNRSTVHQWVNEIADPLAEAVREIVKTLKTINPDAAQLFIFMYLGEPSESSKIPLPVSQNHQAIAALN